MALLWTLRKNFPTHISYNRPILFKCYASSKAKKKNKTEVTKSLYSVGTSLASKGFVRPNKPYVPPANVAEKLHELCAELQIPTTKQQKLDDLEQKFKFLDACYKEFKHSVPNSEVHALRTVGDVIGFYETTVDTTVPFEALKKQDLPENLHIQYDYLRFHPDTDTKFNGKSAFPKSSTLVTGLKYRGKYDGHIAKQSWP